jgi:hypothetical protein
MLNRDIYQKDPSTRKLVNEGVASVNDEKTNQALSVLRYELETFVCDGQYEKGWSTSSTYLKNIEQAEQPAVWVSGFYGSGKSHLVKMLRALWVDSGSRTVPPHAASPTCLKASAIISRNSAPRPSAMVGLHAASGTLGSKLARQVRPHGPAGHHLQIRWPARAVSGCALCHVAQARRHLRRRARPC